MHVWEFDLSWSQMHFTVTLIIKINWKKIVFIGSCYLGKVSGTEIFLYPIWLFSTKAKLRGRDGFGKTGLRKKVL